MRLQLEMLLRFILGLVGLFSAGAQTACCDPLKMACTADIPLCSDMMMPQVTIPPSSSVQPTYFPLPAIETSITSAAMESTMTFGTCIMPAVDIAFVNTDYTVKYMMGRILNCCMKIPMTNMPIVYTQVTRPILVAPLLTAGNWTVVVNPKLSVACNAAFASASRTPVPSTQVQMLTTSRPTVSTTITISVTPTRSITVKVVPSGSATMTPKVPFSATSSATLRVVASQSSTMTPRVQEKPSESATMTPRIQEKPSESSTMTPRIQEKPSESSTMTPRMQEKPSESSTMTPRMQEPTPPPADVIERPSASATMTPRVQEKPSESSTMTPKTIFVERPSESSTMTPRVIERPSESSTMTPRMQEKPSESSTMTPRVIERPSESATMTPRVIERPSESATMTPRMQEKPSESSTITPRVIERQSESSTMTPRVQEKPSESSTMTPRVQEKPSESSTNTPKTIFVERPSSTPTSSVEESAHTDVIVRESESVTPRIMERPSQSNTMTPKIHEPSPDIVIQPVDDSRVSSTPEQIVERPTKSPSSTKSQKIVVSYSSTHSSAPSRAAIRYPTQSISRTSTPSRTIRYVKPSSSARPSKLPVPTKYVVLSPIPVTRRPTPTSIRTQKPVVIHSHLTINNGNVTYLSQPQTLQYIQASLACAAGVPLESIRILNITQRNNGTQSEVIYDKGAPGLSSNGSAVCYRPKTTPTANVARRLQVVDESAVTVDYVIVDPPVEILEPAAFVAAVTGDEGLTQIMAEAGATSMDADVPQEIVDYAAVAAGYEPPVQMAENKTPMYIGAALGAGGLCGLVAAALLVMKARKRSAGKPLTRHVEVIEVNPTVRVIGGSERQMFVPGQIRV